jgi:hypothetical protein
MQFVEAYGTKKDGFPLINLDHVERLDPVYIENRLQYYRCKDSNADFIGQVSRSEIDNLRRQIVPATQRAFVVVFWLVKTDAGGSEVLSEEFPVLAWDLAEDPPEPIISVFISDELKCLKFAGDCAHYFLDEPDDHIRLGFANAAEYAKNILETRSEK